MMLAAAIVLLVCGLTLGAVAVFQMGRSMPTSQTEQQANNQQQPASQQHAVEQPVPENQKEKSAYWTQTKQKIKQGWNRFVEIMEHNDKAVVAISTMVIALFTVFLVCATAALFISSERVAEATKKSTEIASRTLEASQRPWIDLKLEIAGPFVMKPDGAHFSLKYTFNNTGLSPALSVMFHQKFFPGPIMFRSQGELVTYLRKKNVDPNAFSGPLDPVTREFKEFCDNLVKSAVITNKAGHIEGNAIFPKGTAGGTVTINLDGDEFAKARAEARDKAILPIVGGCATYWSDVTQRAHSTGLLFHLLRTGETAMISTEEGLIPAEQLVLHPYFFAASFAN